ncbi:MAG: hypothetical protein WCK67_13080 [bacterium]
MNNLNTYYRVLYKLDASVGWFYAEMSGDEKTCVQKCQKYLDLKKWYDYKLYGKCSGNASEFISYKPDAYITHMTTNLIYLPELKKWYEPNDVMPIPTNKCEISDEFSIDFYFDEVMNDGDFDEGEEPYVTVDLEIKSKMQSVKISVIWDWMVTDIHNFIKKIEQDNYANILIEEWNYTKILVWTLDDKIRVIIQNYDNLDIEIIFDALIDKQLFLSELMRVVEQIEKDKLPIIYRQKIVVPTPVVEKIEKDKFPILTNLYQNEDKLVMKIEHFECRCHTSDHIYKFEIDEDGLVYLFVQMNKHENFFKRLIVAIKYLFKINKNDSYWTDIVIDEKDTDKLIEMLNLSKERVKTWKK